MENTELEKKLTENETTEQSSDEIKSGTTVIVVKKNNTAVIVLLVAILVLGIGFAVAFALGKFPLSNNSSGKTTSSEEKTDNIVNDTANDKNDEISDEQGALINIPFETDFSYDLNNDGTNENIYIVSTEIIEKFNDTDCYIDSFDVYINKDTKNEVVYSNEYFNLEGAGLFDLDTSDNYVDLLCYTTEITASARECYVFRYDGTELTLYKTISETLYMDTFNGKTAKGKTYIEYLDTLSPTVVYDINKYDVILNEQWSDYNSYENDDTEYYHTTTDKLVLYSKDDTSSDTITVDAGTELKILRIKLGGSNESAWIEVSYGDNNIGYIHFNNESEIDNGGINVEKEILFDDFHYAC